MNARLSCNGWRENVSDLAQFPADQKKGPVAGTHRLGARDKTYPYCGAKAVPDFF